MEDGDGGGRKQWERRRSCAGILEQSIGARNRGVVPAARHGWKMVMEEEGSSGRGEEAVLVF
jgi:hypothetical protein